jgi:hypothetical protein
MSTILIVHKMYPLEWQSSLVQLRQRLATNVDVSV